MYKTMSENGWHGRTMRRKECERDRKRFSVAPIRTPARLIRGIQERKKAKSDNLDFHKLRKRKNKRLGTFDFANFALRFARMRIALDSASDAAAGLILRDAPSLGIQTQESHVCPQ